MNVEEYEKMYNQENTYWWFQGRKHILFKMIRHYDLLKNGKARVLDIGCGTGLILQGISGESCAIGVDFSAKALSFCEKRNLKNLVRGDVRDLPIATSSVDLVLALDLLEHIEDDKGLMNEIRRVLRPEGYLLATVPAHRYLWSEHDEALHHYRRYSKTDFRDLVKKEGFTLIKYSYVISLTFLPILIFRLIQKACRFFKPSKNKPKTHIIILPEGLNALLIRILEMEAGILKHQNFPFGVSLLCIAQKGAGFKR
jgi:SAM-dependent methyltransferase